MNRRLLSLPVVLMLLSLVLTQPLSAQRLRQKIGRGVVAVNRSGSTIATVASAGGQGNLISWRKLAEEPEGTKYYVYRRMAGSENFTKLIARAQTVTNYKPTTLYDNCVVFFRQLRMHDGAASFDGCDDLET